MIWVVEAKLEIGRIQLGKIIRNILKFYEICLTTPKTKKNNCKNCLSVVISQYLMAVKKTQIKKTNLEMDVSARIFNALDIDSKCYIFKKDLITALDNCGILTDDVRISQTTLGLKKYGDTAHITAEAFRSLVIPHITLIEKALTGGLVIPDFKNFASFITNLFNRTLQNKQGEVSKHIPELAGVDGNNYALSVCTVDGQRFNIGNHSKKYLARSGANAINYCLAYEDYDEQGIHQKIGRTPKEA